VRKRKKGSSKQFREKFDHTPLSNGEEIPWGGKRLIVGTGAYQEKKHSAATRLAGGPGVYRPGIEWPGCSGLFRQGTTGRQCFYSKKNLSFSAPAKLTG
jgi:hypothetical protein